MRRSFALRALLLTAALAGVAALAAGGRVSAAPPYQPAPVVQIVTTKGIILIKLFPKDAPLTVANFEKLVRSGYYDGLMFYRITNLDGDGTKIVQGGDKTNDGNSGPGWTIKGEFTANKVNNPLTLCAGALAMARLGDQPKPRYDTAGSDFFICVGPNHQLDTLYAVFGMVIKGLDVADHLTQGDRMLKVTMARG
jgi:peptidyl-prolyl cis-trans isomerase B (cyclophilin B)